MIHLLLLTGAAGASSSASIEEKSFSRVATGASVEIDAPGRALEAGKCNPKKDATCCKDLKSKPRQCELWTAVSPDRCGKNKFVKKCRASCHTQYPLMGYCQPSIDMSEYKKISEITVDDVDLSDFDSCCELHGCKFKGCGLHLA